MSKLTKIDKAACVILRKELDAAIAAVLEKHGLSGGFGSARFSDGSVKFKSEFTVKNLQTANGVQEIDNKYALEFIRWHKVYDMERDWLNKSFVYSGVKYEIVGIVPKRRKAPIVVKRPDAKLVCFPSDLIKLHSAQIK